MISVKVVEPAWGKALLDWSNYSREPLLQVIQDETRGVLERAMKFTPPQGGQGQGKRAVEADIKKIFKTEKSFKSGIFKNNEKRSVGHRWRELMKKAVQGGDADKTMLALNAIGKNIGLPHIAFRYGGELYAEHERLRTGKNRRPVSRKGRWNKIWLTPQSQLDEYIKRRQKAVGIHKGGWAVAGRKLGMNFSDYVTRNAKYGSYKIHQNGDIIGTESGNKARGIVEQNQAENILANAISARTRDITRRMALAIKGTLDALQTPGRRFTAHKI
jgi:hypothetical protein